MCVGAHVYKLWMARAVREWPHKLQLPEPVEEWSEPEPEPGRSNRNQSGRHMTRTGGATGEAERKMTKKVERQNNGTAGKSAQSQRST